MKILSIETSCDDTGIAILSIKGDKKSPIFNVLSNIVSSQIEVHKKYGGVFPAMAKREHQKNLVPVLTDALKQAELLNPTSEALNTKQIQNSKFKILNSILEREPELVKKLVLFLKKYEKPDIDLIAVTEGPGLEPCLWVGVNFAKALSYFWNIPVVTTNHIKSHIFVNMLEKGPLSKENFPALCLVVSGGHTILFLMEDFSKYKVLGETRDDAAGECFDKCAKILGLDYPGGPEISKLAAKAGLSRGSRASVKLPRPMINSKDYDFSFSGLKTAVLYKVKKDCGTAPLRSAFSRTTEGRQYIKQMCVEIQQSVIDVLLKKTFKAARDYNVKTLIIGGGVSANKELRKQFSEKVKKEIPNVKYMIPNPELSTDNGVMTAITGYFKYKNGQKDNWKNLKADANLRLE